MEEKGMPPTRERLVNAAVELFSRKWYGTVSVAEICRLAGLSNGIFYRYFTTKEELFKTILGRVLEMIREALDGVAGETRRERLRSLVGIVIRFSEEHADLVSVFREGQYRFFEYERKLVAIYQRSLSSVLGSEIGLTEYLFAFGGLRFCAVRRAFQAAAVQEDSVYSIVADGLFRGMSFDPAQVFGGSAIPHPVPLEEGARDRLLSAGKRLFGSKGFFETNIHEVTDTAGLSVGAFYTYFKSKESYFAELIHLVGREVRGFIARNMDTSAEGSGRNGPASGSSPRRDLNRLEKELRGLWLFLVFLSIDRTCYNIVREAEFVLPAAVREYYGAFVAGYRKNADGNGSAQSGVDEGTAIEFLLGIAHYFGIEVAFDASPSNARAAVECIGAFLEHGLSDKLEIAPRPPLET
jgi:AcrR family transcriptional regulator